MATWNVVSWSPGEVMTSQKMNQMAERDEYLKETKVTGHYWGDPLRSKGVVILAGIATVPGAKGDRNRVPVRFPKTFSGSCRPIITTGMISPSQAQVFINISGLGSTAFPTSNGFDIHAVMSSAYPAAKRKLAKLYVPWQAVGY